MNGDSFQKCIFSIFFVIGSLAFLIGDAFVSKNAFLRADSKDPAEDNNLHSSFEDENKTEFPTNPLELLRVLREIESINNRSSPSDAIEDALKAFESEGQQESSLNNDS